MIRTTGLGSKRKQMDERPSLLLCYKVDKHEHRRALKGNHVLARGGERLDVPNFSPMADSQKLTTAAGIPVVDNQNVITAGRRGPQLLQDNRFLESSLTLLGK